MELDFDADFVKAEEESLGTLVRRNSKADRGRNLKENVANDTVKPEMNMDFVTSGGENIAINSATSSLEKAANMTCKGETKMNANFASSDEESSSTLVLNTSELNTGRNLKENVTNGCKTIIGEIEAGFIEVENREVNLGGKSFEAEQSQVTKVEHSERHENKEYFNGGSSAYPPSVDPSNKSAVLTEMPVDSTHLKASLQSSVYYVEDTGLWKCRHCSWVYPGTNPGVEFIQKHKEHCEGSQINANLDRGSETIDYESKETEFVMSEMVSQTMTEKQNDQKWPSAEGIRESYYTDSETSTGAYVTQSILTGKFNQIENIKNEKSAFLDSHIFSEIGSTATVRDEGLTSNECQDKEENSVIKENHHWNGVFKTVLQQSQDVFLREKDEKQLRENQIRILEKSALEGNVEDIVKILKEQQSHDLVCPNCGSCITKRVILRKRKRTSLVSEGNTDVRAAVSEEEDEITGDQSNRPDIEHVEETEAFGCLACFSLFFQRVVPGVKFFQTKSGSGNNSLAEQYPSENLQDSRMLLEKEKDSFYCFPFIYPWGHSKPGDKLKEPLLNKQYSEKGKALALDESDSYGRLESGAKADYAIETSQRKSGKEAESIPKTMSSESNLRIVDALHQNVALSAIPTTTIGTGILLKNDGEKTTAVNEVGLDEDHTVAENVKLDSLLNVSDKDDDAVKEFTEKLPNRAASHSNITIQNIATYTSTTTKSTLTYSSRVDNVEIKETNYTATETTKTTPYLNGDSESLQLEEQHPRLPNLEVTEGRFKIPPSISIPALNDQTGQVEAKLEVPNESVSEEISDRHVQHADKLAESKQLEKQHVYQKDVKGTEDHLTELSFSASSALSEEHQQSKTEQHYVYASSKHVDKVPCEIETSMDENRIRPQLVTQGEASNGMPDTAGNKELLRSEHQPNDLERNMVVGKAQSDKKDYLCSCIPVSIPTIWSMWSSKELIADEQLKKPLLADPENKLTIDKEVPVALRDDQQGKVIFPSKLDSIESSDSVETQDPATLVQRKVDDSVWPNKVDSVLQSSEISQDSTVINIVQSDDFQQANTGTSVSELSKRPNTEIADLKVVTDWDLLKSIVYGGLTVSITTLGVVSSTAGGEAKTLTVIAIGLANLVAGFFLIIKNILYLDHFHRDEFIETIGHRFWFNGFIATVSYLIFGSLAPITYGFSFQKSDDTLYKFLAASVVSLISIILLALGKARVTKKSYIKVVILYVVTGFWASIVGFFAGKYIKKLLEKWGFTTD
ncbi:hypothetical protein SUGI_1176020 [Cryptomeria japonica]|uniref:uncharacterized protein LOC131035152 isoform X3 n=1 Tax=Cryptomeria japonica TaxID=3369 RepID=UPI0024147954|nr:uncharacterized protein LOC131035152 isoform X3 [Cryptomeria japonica]GLJ54748.1 hypothetical protein SUGI_1176020 [Cryptomeria japonica]